MKPIENEADAIALIAEYRRVMSELAEAIFIFDTVRLQAVARELRRRWWDWQGEDNLHEVCFGEPSE